MAKIIINQERCKGCLLCVSFCPRGLIKKSAKLNKKGLSFVEFSQQAGLNNSGILPPTQGKPTKCVGCMQCAVICPDCCIQVYK